MPSRCNRFQERIDLCAIQTMPTTSRVAPLFALLGNRPYCPARALCHAALHDSPSGIAVSCFGAGRDTAAGGGLCPGSSVLDERRRVLGRLACASSDWSGAALGRPYTTTRRYPRRSQRCRATPRRYACRLQVWLRTHAGDGRQPCGDTESHAACQRHWHSGGADLRPATLRFPPTAELSTRPLVSIARTVYG